jgi:cysteate synthase
MKYMLRCLKCNELYKDNGYLLECHSDALLRTKYFSKFKLKEYTNMLKYFDWLPMERKPNYEFSCAPITYKSKYFAKEFGLKNLYISFNGYWPEKGALTRTCSFKELEAIPTIQRIQQKGYNQLVLSSAGNTARAFMYHAPKANFQIYLVVPKSALDKLWLPEEPSNKNKIIVVTKKDFDYTNSIELAKRISETKGIKSEGGTKNIARRDGMGTVLLDAFFKIKKMPKHYFQAIGSGAGGIAVYEASLRLIENRFTKDITKLHLSQNYPFDPIYKAWTSKREKIDYEKDMINAKKSLKEIYAKVLSNRNPSYGCIGGVYDALSYTKGKMYSITNKEAEESKKIFEKLEGIDIMEAPSIAVASLIKAIKQKTINPKDTILLNITGGGKNKLGKLYKIRDYIKIEDPYIDTEDIIRKINGKV